MFSTLGYFICIPFALLVKLFYNLTQSYGVAIILIDGENSFYLDDDLRGAKFSQYAGKEIVEATRAMLPLSHKRKDTYIGGISMGGYGALKIALRECDSFCAGAGLSPAADISHIMQDKERYLPLYGNVKKVPDNEDLFYLAKKQNKNPNKPRLYIGIGTEDFLYEGNVRFRKLMDELDYDFTYRESAGTHCWEFWDEYIQYVLEWMLGKPNRE